MADNIIKMVVYLGNYGKQYEKTRHNVGWLFEESLEIQNEKISKFKGLFYKDNSGLIHLLPQTLMNNSGQSVIKAMQFFKIKIEEVLVVHDELETNFGSFKLKIGGGLAGHNGLRSIADLTGSRDFSRLCIGISRPVHGSVASYVLQRFNIQEEAELSTLFSGIKEYFYDFIGGKDRTSGKKVVILQQVRS